MSDCEKVTSTKLGLKVIFDAKYLGNFDSFFPGCASYEYYELLW